METPPTVLAYRLWVCLTFLCGDKVSVGKSFESIAVLQTTASSRHSIKLLSLLQECFAHQTRASSFIYGT